VIAVLLAACAGSVDVFAFFGLGHAFAGIVTGNLVTAGYGLATGNASLVKPAVTAVAACIAGEVIWARLLNRRAGNALPLLIAENALLLIVLITWLGTDDHPHGIITIRQLCALIAGAALAGILLRDLRSAVPALPLVLLTAATTIQAWCPSPAHHRDQPSGENAS
jgi:uncharacterized membrane protein YoaK (UPF0700 family)